MPPKVFKAQKPDPAPREQEEEKNAPKKNPQKKPKGPKMGLSQQDHALIQQLLAQQKTERLQEQLSMQKSLFNAQMARNNGQKKNKEMRPVKTWLGMVDLMFYAKHYPGSINAPLVDGTSTPTTRTMVMRGTNFSSTTVFDIDTQAFLPYGTRKYTFFAACPAVSISNGPGTTGYISTATKLGGLMAVQTDSATVQVFQWDWFANSNAAYSYSALFGSQAQSVAEQIFVFAINFKMDLIAPAASSAGKAVFGSFNVSQVINTTQQASVTINNLKRTECESVPVGNTCHLTASLCNNALVSSVGQTITGGQQFGAEMVQWLLVESAFVNQTSGALMTYTIDMEVKANMAFYPVTGDAQVNAMIAPALQQQSAKIQRQLTATNELAGFAFRPDIRAPQELATNGFSSKAWDWLKNKYRTYQPYAAGAIQVAKFLAPYLVEKVVNDTVCVPQEISNLTEVLRYLRSSPLQSSRYQEAVRLFEGDLLFLQDQETQFIDSDEYPEEAEEEKPTTDDVDQIIRKLGVKSPQSRVLPDKASQKQGAKSS